MGHHLVGSRTATAQACVVGHNHVVVVEDYVHDIEEVLNLEIEIIVTVFVNGLLPLPVHDRHPAQVDPT